MAPPVPSPIDRLAQNVVTEYCVAKGQLVGFVETTWLEQRIARLIRDTILSEHERCAAVVGEYARRDNPDAVTVCDLAATAIKNLPLAE